jgi:glucose dehydrogenase
MELDRMGKADAEQAWARGRLTRALVSFFAIAASLTLAARPVSGQWSTVGGDSGSTRYSSLSQINAQNVTKLGAAWVSEKLGPAPTARNPLDIGAVSFDKPGKYVYICKEHPWVYGQIIVEPAAESTGEK